MLDQSVLLREVKKFDPEMEARKMKPTFRLGPITFDIEDTADMLTMLATKLAESLIDRKIIPSTAAKVELDQPVLDEAGVVK